MDGGGRFLRSLGIRVASGPGGAARSHPALAWVLTAAVFGAAGALGAVCGGQYDALAAAYGTPADIAARSLGFDIKTVAISGISQLSQAQVLDIAGIGPNNSLAFLNVREVRARLLRSPFVQDASVRKLFPSQLEVKITEREPFALWQKDGGISVIARDGTVLDLADLTQFGNLPFVVGDEANLHAEEYAALADAFGGERAKVKAGVYVAGRRWNVKLASGLDIKLPRDQALGAVRKIVELHRTARILDKDLASLDLREPGRLVARLTVEASDDRLEAKKAKPAGKGGAV
jgi:cell division protein FtsQ